MTPQAWTKQNGERVWYRLFFRMDRKERKDKTVPSTRHTQELRLDECSGTSQLLEFLDIPEIMPPSVDQVLSVSLLGKCSTSKS